MPTSLTRERPRRTTAGPNTGRNKGRKKGRGSRSARRERPWLASWWPFLLLLALTPVAVRAASVLALSGPSALRLLFPWMALVQAHAPGSLAPEQRDTLAAWALWAQLPLYGLLLTFWAPRGRLRAGLLLVIALQLVGAVAALLPAR